VRATVRVGPQHPTRPSFYGPHHRNGFGLELFGSWEGEGLPDGGPEDPLTACHFLSMPGPAWKGRRHGREGKTA